MNKNTTLKLSRVRRRKQIKRWLMAAILLLTTASILLVEVSYIFM